MDAQQEIVPVWLHSKKEYIGYSEFQQFKMIQKYDENNTYAVPINGVDPS